ncbi:MAG TPA: MBL fold metallo-hydrolase [Candidatus Solibacter sp.]|nr:MBL fold metallo-hydrolase [Candidatus Solibacter sp.]
MRTLRALLILALAAACAPAQTLRIFAIDVEGGKSTLYVSPSGESMLVDTGYAGNNGRDANRIAAAAASAGVKRIDYLVITHYHGDHAGGVPQLAAKLPIGKIFDHGDSFEQSNQKTLDMFQTFAAVRAKYPHQTLHPGDMIPIKGLRVDIVGGAGKAIASPLAGAGQPNPLCSSHEALPPDPGENALSLAMIITFGGLRIADLGDLYWNQEHALVCPNNKLGVVDLYMTTHHGTATSGPPEIVHALHPRVAIMNNGADKGGSVKAWTTIEKSPGLEDLWQLHFSNEGGKDHNVAESFIANLSGEKDAGYSIQVVARADGLFTVRNGRNRFEKTYRK